MENELYLINLYDCYKNLLTKKQKEYFEDYYFNNLSLTEISENESVSRNAIHKQLKEVCLKLNDFEDKLKVNEKYEKILKLVDDNIKEKIEEIMNN